VDKEVLNGLFRPKSVAVVGASATPGKIGYTVLDNLRKNKYEGKVYPVNPKSEEILGMQTYPSVLDIPGPLDAAVIVVPAKFVPEVTEECGKKGVKGLIIIASGFSEAGEHELEEEVVKIANSYGTRVLGPNIVGVLSNSDEMNASFAPFLPLPGKASLVSQSGALLIAIDASTYTRRVGFDKLISIGNMSDVDFADTIKWLDDDPDTNCITLYIEGIRDGRAFMDASRHSHKPIIALKSGTSSHGAAAAASHTGSLAGAAKVYSAAFQQSGIIQAADLDNLFDRTLALSLQPPMNGDNLLIITNGGGVGVLATDAAENFGLPLKFAPKDVQEELKKHMPEFGSAKNPVDLTGMAGSDWYNDSVSIAIDHPWVDGLVVLYCETAMTDPLEISKGIKQAIDNAKSKDKPVVVSLIGGDESAKAIQWLVEHDIPAYGSPEVAVNVMAALREQAKAKITVSERPEPMKDAHRDEALKIINHARSVGRDSLTEIEAKELFKAYGLPVTRNFLARNEEEAVKVANKIGFPVVMKIVSPDILHKSDAGGVKVNIEDENGVRESYKTIMKNVMAYKEDADIHGIIVQEMAPWGTEIILGSINDPTFGPTMMFGLGGIFVEVLKDVTFRVAPVSANQARNMLDEIRGAPIIAGVRGEAPRDRDAMAETISRYSKMILDLKDEISESDANPILVYEKGKGLKIVDARVILTKK
jgi:acetyl coenzyme A synthetase (ADP forming)-like protein